MSESLTARTPAQTLHDFVDTLRAGYQAENYEDYKKLTRDNDIPGALASVIDNHPKAIRHDPTTASDSDVNLSLRGGMWVYRAHHNTALGAVAVARRMLPFLGDYSENIYFGDEESFGDQGVIKTAHKIETYTPQHYGRGPASPEELNMFLELAGGLLARFVKVAKV